VSNIVICTASRHQTLKRIKKLCSWLPLSCKQIRDTLSQRKNFCCNQLGLVNLATSRQNRRQDRLVIVLHGNLIIVKPLTKYLRKTSLTEDVRKGTLRCGDPNNTSAANPAVKGYPNPKSCFIAPVALITRTHFSSA